MLVLLETDENFAGNSVTVLAERETTTKYRVRPARNDSSLTALKKKKLKSSIQYVHFSLKRFTMT